MGYDATRRTFMRHKNKGLAPSKPLILLVGAVGIEPTTRGLKVSRCYPATFPPQPATICMSLPLALSPEVWECMLPSREVISIVRTEAEAHHVCRECRVFTIDEIGRLIDGLPDAVLEAKKVFPGVTITAVRECNPIDWEVGDDLPI